MRRLAALARPLLPSPLLASPLLALSLLALSSLVLSSLATGCALFGAGTAPVVYEQRCADASCLEDFVFTDATKWRVRASGHGPALELVGKSDYRPPHRSPLSIALIEGLEVRDFDLDVDLLQTGRNYGHRDLCLFFGVQSKSRFYYTHLATSPDANAHNVFLVNDAPRANLIPPLARGVDWGRASGAASAPARSRSSGTTAPSLRWSPRTARSAGAASGSAPSTTRASCGTSCCARRAIGSPRATRSAARRAASAGGRTHRSCAGRRSRAKTG